MTPETKEYRRKNKDEEQGLNMTEDGKNHTDDDFTPLPDDDDMNVRPIDMDEAPRGQSPDPFAPATPGTPAPPPESSGQPPHTPDQMHAAPPETGGQPPEQQSPQEDLPPEQVQQEQAQQEPPQPTVNPDLIAQEAESKGNLVGKGITEELTAKYPRLQNITIAAGWDQRAIEEQMIDIDLSVFLLDRNDKTREDTDFIFYNTTQDKNGAVRHLEDSRTGAGEGDDEAVALDLNGISFDVMKIMVVLSVYDPAMDGKHFGMVKNMFIRIINAEDDYEMLRFMIDNDDLEQNKGTGMYGLCLYREGPKWLCDTLGEIQEGGLAKIATDYDIIVREMQSTGG